jgi:hypothetical protein
VSTAPPHPVRRPGGVIDASAAARSGTAGRSSAGYASPADVKAGGGVYRRLDGITNE